MSKGEAQGDVMALEAALDLLDGLGVILAAFHEMPDGRDPRDSWCAR
jgi:hypothetical protein